MISKETKFVPDKSTDMDIVSDRDEIFEQSHEIIEQPLNNSSNSDSLECSHCHKLLPLTEFYVTTNYYHEKRGRTYRCKECSRQSARDSLAKKKAKKVMNI